MDFFDNIKYSFLLFGCPATLTVSKDFTAILYRDTKQIDKMGTRLKTFDFGNQNELNSFICKLKKAQELYKIFVLELKELNIPECQLENLLESL